MCIFEHHFSPNGYRNEITNFNPLDWGQVHVYVGESGSGTGGKYSSPSRPVAMSRSNIDDNIAHNEGSEDDAKVTTLGSTVVEGEKDCIFNHVDANNNVIVILE